MTHRTFITIFLGGLGFLCNAQKLEPIKYGDFENWVSRDIAESVVIGGKHKTIFEVGPTQTITKNVPYRNLGGSPWATSNVYAKVSGVTKGSNAVYPSNRSATNKCAKLCTQMEKVKVLGLINMNVMVAGSMFLGEMIEPVSSTSDPYKKMEMGVKYNKRPSYLSLDLKVDMPPTDTRTRSTGFGPKKILPGRDAAVVFVMLQRRWEDADGNLHAARVATGGEHFKDSTPWKNGYKVPLVYGDVSSNPNYNWLGLRNGKDSYYARNSKGQLVKVQEEMWDSPDATPTHAIVMLSSGNGEPFIGTEGLTFYVDNVAFGF
ncbi:MAG: PCMD domain-containing protein [Paramuribaculum sp.]|nr:PCMD domain-containing protein [Paramuribaculum sp.]